MSHLANQVLAAFKAAIDLTEQTVYLGRVYDVDRTPAHSIYLGPAQMAGNNLAFVDVNQTIRDEMSVTGLEEEIDQIMLEAHAAAYKEIMKDRTLGLPSFVLDTELESMSEPDYIADGAKPILSVVFNWSVKYRHSLNDPGVLQ